MSDMDKAPILAVARLRDLAIHHEMPEELVEVFMIKCLPDLLSGQTMVIWKIEGNESPSEDHIIMQARTIRGLNIDDLKEGLNDE